MLDCSGDIARYHDKKVTLPKDIQDILRGHRKANQDRLKQRLKEKNKPLPTGFVKQGSYAMKTMTQHHNNDYDIDDGALFDRDDLGQKSALDARKMVCDVLQDDRFKKQPEVRPNCVRVYYDGGYHVDIPVYRTRESGDGYELASVDWKESNPTGVTKWFEDSLSGKTDKGTELRRLVRLLKRFARSRDSWNLPSGFALTVLANEVYAVVLGRDDKAFYDLLVALKNRLLWSKTIKHPVVNEYLSDGKEHCVDELVERIEWAIDKLSILHNSSCTRLDALKAWRDVFNTDFFDKDIEDEDAKRSAAKSFSVLSATPSSPVQRDGGGRYGQTKRHT